MGGAVHVRGNLAEAPDEMINQNTVAEWNVWVDPQGSHEVYTSGVPLVLVPLDATN